MVYVSPRICVFSFNIFFSYLLVNALTLQGDFGSHHIPCTRGLTSPILSANLFL